MTAIIVLNKSGAETARKISGVTGADIHARFEPADVLYESFGDHIRGLFERGEAMVIVAAAGAVTRTLAPVLSDKLSEPPVVVVGEDGSAVIPLLGGHHGANDLARDIAASLGVSAAITTASDLAFGIAFDDPPAGWVGHPGNDYKSFISSLLAQRKVRLDGDAEWLTSGSLEIDPDAELAIAVTEQDMAPSPTRLVYYPQTLAIGVGCERHVEIAEVADLVRQVLKNNNLSPLAVAAVCSIDLKSDETAILALADELNRPGRFFDAATLEAETPRLKTPSDLVYQEVGCHGVAEGAALAAAGPSGELIVAKQKSKRATCAIARSPSPINAKIVGSARGHLSVVGIGPGDQTWRTPEADALIDAASDLVGYSLYLDILGPAIDGKTRHDFGLGQEEERVRFALELAAEGKNVALVSSGDIGIYAMATLVFELMDKSDRPDWQRMSIQVTPGVSAMQACAARIGAPLGHDFCTISLSDLLTPWASIQTRLKAAAEGDFVVAFYNPVSMRRRTQLQYAKETLLGHRPPETPVIIGRSLGRPEERLEVTSLQDLDPEQIDMLTMVIVGSSESRHMKRTDGGDWVYTPRGYSGKSSSEMLDKDKKAAS